MGPVNSAVHGERTRIGVGDMGNMQGCCMPQQANVMEVQPPTIEVIARRVACAPFC